MNNFNIIHTGIMVTLRSGLTFEFSSDKECPLDDITIVNGILSVDDYEFKVPVTEVKSIQCWDEDQQMDDCGYVEFA